MRATIDWGIDLGTTNSAIAHSDGQRTTLITGPTGNPLLPSVVHVDGLGNVQVGARARERLSEDPENTCAEFKRLMGTGESRTFAASGRVLLPEELSAAVLTELLSSVEPGSRPRAAVVTVPAMFQLPQCEATKTAAQRAGLEHAVLLQEPIAAAIAHCGVQQAGDGAWLVYDLGGGTFDVSLVRSRGGRLSVLDHDGDNHLGGRDFDRLVTNEAARLLRESGFLGAFRRSDPDFALAFARLRSAAERARLTLSQADEVTIHCPDLRSADGSLQTSFEHILTRSALETLIEPLLVRTVQICKRLLARNRMHTDAIRSIVLVGGPTRTPCLPAYLRDQLGIDARHEFDPMTLVASGAAIFAATQKLPERLVPRPGTSLTLQLEYEPMTTSPRPVLAGKVVGGDDAGLGAVRVRRDDGLFASTCALSARKAFVVPLELRPNAVSQFEIQVLSGSGQPVPAEPSTLSILHGLSIAAPPLSESLGIMLANNRVAWCLRKGVALPARTSVTCATTMALDSDSQVALNVPIVQGESELADRNKVVGVLLIRADGACTALPSGAQVDVEVAIDASCQTRARAYVPALDRWFEDVVTFAMDLKAPTEVNAQLTEQRSRMAELERLAGDLESDGDRRESRVVQEIEELLEDGDRDSIDLADQLLRRMTRDLDQAEADNRGESLRRKFGEVVARVGSWTGSLGDAADTRIKQALEGEFHAATSIGDWDTAQQKLETLSELEMRLLARTPEYWIALFQALRSRFGANTNPPSVAASVTRGERAAAERWVGGLQQACQELVEALPSEEREKMDMPPSIVSHVS